MPQRYTPADRETTDLHAPWWSAATDPATGRYLERAVIYTKLLWPDQKWLSARMLAALGDHTVDLSALPDSQDPTEMGKALLGSGLSLATLTQSLDEDDLIVRLVVEITDATGAPMPWSTEAVKRQTLSELDGADVQFISQELQRRTNGSPVPVLPADQQAAASGDPAAANGRGAQGVAEAAFRGAGEPGLS